MDTTKTNKQFYQKKDYYCVNCGHDGHNFKACTDPVTSYGIILTSIEFPHDINMKEYVINSEYNGDILVKNNAAGINIDEYTDIELFCGLKNNIKFLLIRRKHTLGFLEFIRGRYNIENVDGIIFLFKQMTPQEINKIRVYSFDELWDEVWGENKNKLSYQNEYTISKDKFTKLKSQDNGYLSLSFYVDNVIPGWENAEWGFPKGRRNIKETDKECAIREFKEESGIDESEYVMLDNIDPIVENFIGTNGINYKHVYYLAVSNKFRQPVIDINNRIQYHEVGDINYFVYEEAMKMIRPYHTERLKIVTSVFIFIVNTIIKSLKSLT